MAQVSLLVSFLPTIVAGFHFCHPIVAMVENAEIFKTAAILSLACQVRTIRARMGEFELIILSLCCRASVFVLVLYVPALVSSLHSPNVILR